MIDFIVKYWVEFLFGLVITGLSFFVKHFYSLWKKDKEAQKKELSEQIKEELKNYNQQMLNQKEALLSAEDIKLKGAIDQVETSNTKLYNAVLDVQKKQFKDDCRAILESEDLITFEQFEDLHAEYEIYKSLGGNGPGSTLFDLVLEKYSTQLMSKNQVDYMSQKLNLPQYYAQQHSQPQNIIIQKPMPRPPQPPQPPQPKG